MQIFHHIDEWRQVRKNLPLNSSLGFVPTMGNLHPGHISLMQASQRENNLTVASIFINPTDFNRVEDFKFYPRTLEADLELLAENGVDYCILPQEQDIYPEGYRYKIDEVKHSLLMEGQHRPGHYAGVLTVVMKLLNIVQPHRSYFGEKDYQQYELIRDMAAAFFMDVEIKVCPTIRESSGLAYSSRNNRLNAHQRQLAEQFARIFHQKKPLEQIKMELTELGIGVDYIEKHNGRNFAAVIIDDIRLIDNY
jgi:pantoate--beta-alanine ligase